MKIRVFRSSVAILSCTLVIISFFVLFGCISTNGAILNDELDLVQKIVDGSPWSGSYHAGRVVFSFYLDKKSKLAGELVDGSSPYGPVAVGVVKWLEVKNGLVTFMTQGGFDYELRMENERLVGSLRRSNYNSPVVLIKKG